MAEDMYSLLTPTASPLSLTITATTTLEDVMNATIFHPLHDKSTQLPIQGDVSSTHQPNHSEVHTTQTYSLLRTPDTTRTQPSTKDTSPAETRLDDALFSLLDSPRKQTKLTKNPMFRDLQAILKADCTADATPISLFETLPKRKTTYTVASREPRLKQRLSKLSDCYQTQVTQFSSFHKYHASIVETDRYRELHQLANPQPTLRTANNHFYDQMLHEIIDRVEISVGTMEALTATNNQPKPTHYQPSTNSASTQYISTTNSAPTQYQPTSNSVPTQYQPSTNLALTQYHPSSNSVPTQYQPSTNSAPTQYHPSSKSVPTQYQPSTNSAPTHYQPTTYSAPTQYQPTTNTAPSQYSTVINSTHTQYQTITSEAPFRLNLRIRPSLSKHAIRLMEVWYHANIDHPYPDTQDAETLEIAGRITEEQVKKWFANKRNRSRNILPISQIARRKRQIQAAINRVIRITSLY